MASPAATGAVIGVWICTAHSWLDGSFTVKRIASVNGCPATVIGFASAALALSPMILNAAMPAPPSRSTRGRPAMRAFAASWTGLDALTSAGAGPGVAAAGALPTAAGGGAVRLMQPAPIVANARNRNRVGSRRALLAAYHRGGPGTL